MRFRQSNLVGIDISESSIKVLQLNAAQDIVAYGTRSLPPGVVSLRRILNKEAFAEHLNAVLLDTKPKVLNSTTEHLRAVVCLPESALFTHYMTLPKELSKAEIAPWIKTQASLMIPIPVDELYFDHHVVESNGESKATFVGVRKHDLDTYMEAFAQAHIMPAFLVGELFALGYALLPSEHFDDDYIVVDIGAHSTTIGIFGEDNFANASFVVPIGGEDITESLVAELKLTQEEAEMQKREQGVGSLDEDPTEAQVLIRAHVATIIEHIEESRLFFEEKTRDRIEHVVVAGGSALLPGLIPYLKEHLRTDVSLADPLVKVHHAEHLQSNTPGILFSNVIGLALYALDADDSKLNLLHQYRFQESDTQKETMRLTEITSSNDLYYVMYTRILAVRSIIDTVRGYIKHHNPTLNGKLILTLVVLISALGALGWVLTTYL